MKKIFLFNILFFLILNSVFSQIELNVNKINRDSFNIYFTKRPDLQINKPYRFIVKTNIKKEDSIILAICSNKGFLENNLEFTYTFTHHIYPFTIERKTASDSKVFFDVFRINNIKGVKYILKVDGKQYYKHKGGSFGPKSVFSLDFISDLYDLTDIEIKDPVYFSTWYKNKKRDSLFLKNYHLSFKPEFSRKIIHSQKDVWFFIIFPQVYYKGQALLPEKETERMAILTYDKNMKN